MSLLIPSPATYDAGWVYVLSNEGHPGILKIGLTRRRVEDRLAQLNGAGTIHNHVNRFSCHVRDPAILEAAAHQALADHRIKGKEFFKVSLNMAIATIERVIAERELKVFERVGGIPPRKELPEAPKDHEKPHPHVSPPVHIIRPSKAS